MRSAEMGPRGRRATDLTPVDEAPWRFRWRYISANPFEYGIALAAMIAALVYLLDPHSLSSAAIGQEGHGLAPVWSVLYVSGGALILAACTFGDKHWSWRVEVAGLVLFGQALLVNAFAIWVLAGQLGAGTVATYCGLVAAAVVRIRVIVKLTGARAASHGQWAAHAAFEERGQERP